MQNKTIASYGGVKEDASPVKNPRRQIAASEFNRSMADTAQMTRTAMRVSFEFDIDNSGPLPVADAKTRTVWGTGAAHSPAVTRTAAGVYLVTFPTTKTDELGATDTVSLLTAGAHIVSGTVFGVVQVVPSGNLIQVFTANMSGVITEFANGTSISVWAN